MVTKMFRSFCVFTGTLFFVLSSIQAQVIESVSYTPAKSGKYETIATKSMSYFAGNLQADNVLAHGDRLTADFSANTITVVSPRSFNASRDIYFPSSSNNTIAAALVGPDSKFYTTAGNVSVGTASEMGAATAKDINFANITANLAVDSLIDLNGVKMENPKCAVKWVKMPAFTKGQEPSATPSSYWFAYCDYNPCSGNTPYYCSGVCKACPCFQVNVGTGSSPQCLTLNTAQLDTNLTLIGECSAGWDGHFEIGPGEPSGNKCKYASEDIYSGSFNCTNQTIKRCGNGSFLTESFHTFQSSYTSLCTDSSRLSETSEDLFVPGTNIKCSEGIYPLAIRQTSSSQTIKDAKEKHIISPIQVYSVCTNPEAIENHKKRLRKMYCGFSGTTSDEVEDSIGAMLTTKVSINCPSALYSNESIKYCSQLYPALNTESANAEQMCIDIRANNTSVGNSFSCFLNAPRPNQYKAIRYGTCTTEEESIEYCANTGRCDGGLDTVCKTTNWKQKTRVKKVRPWCSDNSIDCELTQACNVPSNPPSSSGTLYLPQVVRNGSMLQCAFN